MGGALFFYSYHIHSVYLFPLFYPFQKPTFQNLFLYPPISYRFYLFRDVTKMLSKPFVGSW